VDYVHQFAVADVDLDGDRDIVMAEMTNSTRRRVAWFANGGGGSSWAMRPIASGGSHNIRAVDIDRDTDIDVVGANYDTGPIELWRNRIR
jgi:hypothetical protein